MPLPDELVDPAPARLSRAHPAFDRIVGAHRQAVASGAPGYRDPLTGLFVFSAAYLWERGFCCDTGCRHCPYAERRPAGSSTPVEPD